MLGDEIKIEKKTLRRENGLGKITCERGKIVLLNASNGLLGHAESSTDDVENDHGERPSNSRPACTVEKDLREMFDERG